ncbi:ABC transporter permease [Mediterraneibacter massiliensis]|jgi:ribose transport system permease protein|uniref:ABC transporter permease n=1 Tax=Mediterraneibacter massiliensis TaxID=1720300 RepID=UPI00073E4EC3|nr:ABC transporter permease [Mediterraneibacter massiliensis]RGT75156.1 ABC transporter permease [Ruminococcus sp. AF18-22]
MKKWYANFRRQDSFFGIVITTIVVLILAVSSPYFFTISNLDSLQTSIAPNAILAIGMMMLMIMGKFDLSVGSSMCLSGIACAYCLSRGMGITISVLAGLGVGLVIGSINGLLVAYGNIEPLIATIGTMYVFRGMSEMIMTGSVATTLRGFPEAFVKFGNGKILGLYPMVWICIILLALFGFILKKTYTGKKNYYIGCSEFNAKLMGIHVKGHLMWTYILSGCLASIAGIMSVARYETASRYLGKDIQMNIMIACIIGGSSLLGGKGDMVGALFGTLFISLLSNGFNLFEINPQWQNVTIGSILMLVVAMDGYVYLKRLRQQGKA